MFGTLFAPAALATPTVDVLNTGTGAKKVLRSEVSHATRQDVVFSWNMNMTTKIGSMDVPIDLPPVTASMSLQTLPATSADEVHYTMTLSQVDLEMGEGDAQNPLLESMRRDMKNLSGMVSTGVMRRNGQVLDMDMSKSGSSVSMADQLSGAMTQSLVVFPDVPVGVGAKWTSTEDVEEQGMKFQRETTYEVTSLKGSEVALTITLGGKPLSTQVQSPDLPPGATAELVSLSVSGTGTVLYSLTDLFPKKSHIDVQLNTQW